MPETTPAPAPAAPPLPEPQAGGSYLRDPVTGALSRVQTPAQPPAAKE